MKTKLTDPNKPVMIGARIHPRLQYGLRLLARVQGGTIAEAVEWAISLALRTTRIGSGVTETRLNVIVDKVWGKPSEPQQIHVLDKEAPELLDFDQRAAWNLVKRCDDLWTTAYWARESTGEDENGAPDYDYVEVENESDAEHTEVKPNFDLIEAHWPAIRELGLDLGRAGEIENFYTLAEILDGSARGRAGI